MRTLNDYFVTAKITTISTAGSTFVPIPDGGRVIKIITSIKNAISSADADQRFLVTEYTLEAKNELSSGLVTDVTTS